MPVNILVVLVNDGINAKSARPKYLVQVTTEKTEGGLSLPPSHLLKAIRILKRYPWPRHKLHMCAEIMARVEESEKGMFFVFYSKDRDGLCSFHLIRFDRAIKMSGKALMEEVVGMRYVVDVDRANRDAAIMADTVARESR